jgi:hypothetical protein
MPSPPGERRWLTAPVITGGAIGVAGLTLGAFFALQFRSENNQAKSLCADNVCLSTVEKTMHDTLVSDARRDRVLALVGAGVGGAALLTAAYFWWRPAHGSSKKTFGGPIAAFGVPTASGRGWIASAELAW